MQQQQHQQSSSSVTDVMGKSSPTRSSFPGLTRGGGSLSAGGVGGVQATAGGGGMQPGSSATPSWVLPKKSPPATVAGGIPAQRDVSGSGLPSQFGGISLSDHGVSSGVSS